MTPQQQAMKTMIIPTQPNFQSTIILVKVDVIKFFESHGRKLALHVSIKEDARYKYVVSDFLTGVMLINSKTMAGAIRESHEIMKQAIDKNHDFGQYVEYNSVDFAAGVDFAEKIISENSKVFIEGLKHKLNETAP